MIPVVSSAVSCVVLCLSNDQPAVLMLKRCLADGGHWNHVCGGIKAGETGVQAIVRELYEETGLTQFKLFDGEFIEQFFQPLKNRIMLLPLFVAIVDKPAEVRLNDEHTNWRWVSRSEAKELVNYAQQKAMLDHVWSIFVNNDFSKKPNIPFTPYALHNC